MNKKRLTQAKGLAIAQNGNNKRKKDSKILKEINIAKDSHQ